MATFVYDTGGLFDSSAFCQLHPNSIAYLNNQVAGMSNSMAMLTDHARGFFTNLSQQIYKTFDESEMIRNARAAARMIGNAWQHDGIMPISDIGQLQHATPTMIRWVMANPVVRNTWLQGMCEGYGEAYLNTTGNTNGFDNYDYRRATNSVYMPIENAMMASTYIEAIKDGDRELHVMEQADISIAWNTAERFMKLGVDDPTSRTNSRL